MMHQNLHIIKIQNICRGNESLTDWLDRQGNVQHIKSWLDDIVIMNGKTLIFRDQLLVAHLSDPSA